MPEYTCRASFRTRDTSTGTLAVNVLHFSAAQLSSPAGPQTWADDLYTWLGTTYRNMLPTSYTWDNITTNTVEEPGADPGEGIHLVNLAGSRAPTDTKLNPGLGILVSFKTGTPKRYARGRMHPPPALSSTELQAGNYWLSANPYQTAVQAFLTALLAGHTIGDTTYFPTVFSRTELSRGAAKWRFPILTASIAPHPHFLRSRESSP